MSLTTRCASPTRRAVCLTRIETRIQGNRELHCRHPSRSSRFTGRIGNARTVGEDAYLLRCCGSEDYVRVDTSVALLANARTATRLFTTITVTLDFTTFSLSNGRNGSNVSTELSTMMAHEGQHGIVQRLTGGSRTSGENRASEESAFLTQAAVNEGLGHKSCYGIWSRDGGLNPKAIQEWVERANREFCSQRGANCQ
jgi:hypothetical protein